jgi:long-chain acyl-CoA synthetase
VVEGYGLSEASPVTHVGPLDGTARPGTIGLPLPDTEAIVVDAENGTDVLPPGQVGELIIRGSQVMAGYWNDPEATANTLRDGWLHTGDLATMDADGFFKIVDRKKDLIITSGFNVYPTDVEHVLRQYEELEDVAVLGVPDPQRGELVKAVVVAKNGVKFHRRAFDEFARQHLEVHKRPRIVEVVRGPLPRNPLGKVLRRVLREQHSADGQPHEEEEPATESR